MFFTLKARNPGLETDIIGAKYISSSDSKQACAQRWRHKLWQDLEDLQMVIEMLSPASVSAPNEKFVMPLPLLLGNYFYKGNKDDVTWTKDFW